MPSTVRVPTKLYQTLREIRLSLESKHFAAAPTMQDLVSVAIKRFIRDWDNSDEQIQILEELFKNRDNARSRMGKRKHPPHTSEE